MWWSEPGSTKMPANHWTAPLLSRLVCHCLAGWGQEDGRVAGAAVVQNHVLHPDELGGVVTPSIGVTCAMRDRPSGAVQLSTRHYRRFFQILNPDWRVGALFVFVLVWRDGARLTRAVGAGTVFMIGGPDCLGIAIADAGHGRRFRDSAGAYPSPYAGTWCVAMAEWRAGPEYQMMTGSQNAPGWRDGLGWC